MRFNTLEDWLRWQENCHPSAIDLGLDRVREVASRLDLLNPQATIIAVAGTNGKGTCVATIEAVLSEAGFGCGVYSSPHLLHYCERIKISGHFASDEALCRAFSAIDNACQEISLTYFEFGTLAALYLFKEAKLPYWILEVGMGGRLDAVNIMDADLTIITSIALDHVDWLGNDRETIGREKAGICRVGVPLIVADPSPPESVLNTAAELNCPTYLIGKDFSYSEVPEGTVFKVSDICSSPQALSLPKPSIAAAFQACSLLLGFSSLPESALSAIQLKGRLQYETISGRQVVFDVAHNPAAFAYLCDQLKKRHAEQKWSVVVAMMADKNLAESLEALSDIAGHWYLTTIKGLSRAAAVGQLKEALPSGSVSAEFDCVAEALEMALQSPHALPVLVTGSFYTVSEALRNLQERNQG